MSCEFGSSSVTSERPTFNLTRMNAKSYKNKLRWLDSYVVKQIMAHSIGNIVGNEVFFQLWQWKNCSIWPCSSWRGLCFLQDEWTLFRLKVFSSSNCAIIPTETYISSIIFSKITERRNFHPNISPCSPIVRPRPAFVSPELIGRIRRRDLARLLDEDVTSLQESWTKCVSCEGNSIANHV